MDDVDSRKRARQDLEDIATLKKTPAFTRYFERRVTEELAKRAEKVLGNRNLTKEELWEEWLRYQAVKDISTMLLEEDPACRNIIGPGAEGDD